MKDPLPGDAAPRLDKWLWAARFFKTRGLANEQIDKGRVAINGQQAKPSRAVRVGDLIEFQQDINRRTVKVIALSHLRGPASIAQLLYEETTDSIATRERAVQQRRLAPEPSSTIDQGRQTKRDRRQLAEWQRWSASAEPDH